MTELAANYNQLRLWSEDYHDTLIVPPKGHCCICDEDVETPYETPADVPFFAAHRDWHCQDCEDWLNLPDSALKLAPRSLRVDPPEIPASETERWVPGISDEMYCDEDD